jgi:cobalt-zinc-cadmium efflux system protein
MPPKEHQAQQEDGTAAHHGHMPPTGDVRALAIAGVLTGTYFIIELAIGLWTRSVAVTSDAFHTFSAVGGVLIALAASRYGRRAANPFQTFGYLRAEIIGALFNGLFLLIMAGVVLWMGAMRLRMPVHLPTWPMLWAAAGGLATEAVSFWLLYGRQKENLNVRGALWHILQTLVGSLLIVVTALVIRFTGFLRIDAILGMTFGLVLFWASWRIIREALSILLQGTPKDLDLAAVIDAIRRVRAVTSVHHVHAWSLTSGRNIFSAHVCIDDPLEGPGVLEAIQDLLSNRFGIYFSTVQVEQRCRVDSEGAPDIDIMRAAAQTRLSTR